MVRGMELFFEHSWTPYNHSIQTSPTVDQKFGNLQRITITIQLVLRQMAQISQPKITEGAIAAQKLLFHHAGYFCGTWHLAGPGTWDCYHCYHLIPPPPLLLLPPPPPPWTQVTRFDTYVS